MVKVKYRFSSILVDERRKQLAKKRQSRKEANKKFGFYAQSVTGAKAPNLKGSPFLTRWRKRMGY